MYTLNIAICENTRKDAALVRRMIADSGVACRIFNYKNGEEFLDAYQLGFFQLVLLEIYYGRRRNSSHTGAVTGLTVAQIIRESDNNVWLAFTTTSRDHAAEGYKVMAARYLVKPLVEDEITSLLRRAEQHWQGLNDEISIMVERRLRSVRIRDILYVEAQNKQSIIHMRDENIATYTKIDGIAKMLDFTPFVRCHHSYVVNMGYVESIDRDFTIVNGDTVQIGRNFQWKSRRAYREYIMRLAREGEA